MVGGHGVTASKTLPSLAEFDGSRHARVATVVSVENCCAKCCDRDCTAQWNTAVMCDTRWQPHTRPSTEDWHLGAVHTSTRRQADRHSRDAICRWAESPMMDDDLVLPSQ